MVGVAAKRSFAGLFLICLAVLSPPAAQAAEDAIVLTADDIAALQALTIGDVLNTVPGVSASDTSVSIHGSYKVKVFVDGRQINDVTSNHGGVNWGLVHLRQVVRIEVLKGKGGLAYGQNTSGGVILITTAREQRLSGSLMAYGGTDDTGRLKATVNTRLGPCDVNVNGGYLTTSGYNINNDKERYQAGFKLGWSPAEEKHFELSFSHIGDTRGLNGRPERPTPFSRKKSQNNTAALQADIHTVKSKTYYNGGWRHNRDRSRHLSKRLQVSRVGEDVNMAVDGGRWGRFDLGASGWVDQADGTGFKEQQEEAVGAFGLWSYRFPRLHLGASAGLRFNYHSRFDNRLNPELKLTCKRKKWRLSAAYNRSHNTPSFYQRYNETSGTRPNPELEMETANNFSLAFSASPHERFSFGLTGFYNRLTDRITYVLDEDGMGRYRNIGNVRYAGGDFSANAALLPTLNARLAYTLLEVRDRDTGRWITAKPRHKLYASLRWQPLKDVSLTALATYSDKVYRDTRNTKTIPAYTVWDLRGEYLVRDIRLFSEVKNLFDKTRYYSDGLLAPPLTWIVGLEWKL